MSIVVKLITEKDYPFIKFTLDEFNSVSPFAPEADFGADESERPQLGRWLTGSFYFATLANLCRKLG